MMSEKLLIRGGQIVNDDQTFKADILIEDGKITKIEADIVDDEATIVDASDKVVFPGGIDTQTHFQLPVNGLVSPDDFYHGTLAALSGGTTTIIDCVMPRCGESLVDAFSRWRQWSDGNACCDYALQVGINGFTDSTCKEMKDLVNDKGVNMFKVFLAAPQCEKWCVASDQDVYRCAEKCKELGALLCVHAEDEILVTKNADDLFSSNVTGPEGHLLSRPEELESASVRRAVTLVCEGSDAPVYIPNVMSKSTAKVVKHFHSKGYAVFSETTVGAIGASGRHVFNRCWQHSASHVTSPPLRPNYGTAGYLMKLLANDDIQMVSSNHCTFNASQRAVGKDDFRLIPRGVNGVEDRLSVIWQLGVVCGRMDLCRFVSVTSSTAAKIFNIYPKKGRIAVGSDADLVVWDPNRTRVISYKTHRQNCDFNIFDGMICRGSVHIVIYNGRVVVENEKCSVTQGQGKFLPLPTHSEFVFSRLSEQLQKTRLSAVNREIEGTDVKINGTACVSETSENHISDTVTDISCSSSASVSTEDLLSANEMPDSPFRRDFKKRAVPRFRQPPGGKSSPLW